MLLSLKISITHHKLSLHSSRLGMYKLIETHRHTHKRCTSLHIIHYECHEVILFYLQSSTLLPPLLPLHLLLFLLSHFLSPDSPLLLTLFSYFSYLISSFDSSHSSLIPPSPFLPLTLLTLLLCFMVLLFIPQSFLQKIIK